MKFLGANGSGELSDAIECVDYAISKGAMIMNNSWGGGGFSSAMSNAIERARLANILFVAAAGNIGSDNDAIPAYPASYPQTNIVAVAALDRRDQRASFSNYGQATVDIGAPGVEIFSSTATSNTSYDVFQGTSMAAPHVSGVAALLRSRFPGISVVTLKQRLLSTAVAVPSLAGVTVAGGRVSASAALGATVDGVLEVTARVPSLPLRAAASTNVFVSVTDLGPVTGATVSAHFGALAAVNLRDNGVAPDSTVNDGVYSATLNVAEGNATVTLTVTASAPGKLRATDMFDFDISSPPSNDNFAARIVIGAGASRSAGSNINAGVEAGEPRNPSVAGGRSVWWSWTAAATGAATITTAGSSFDTTLAVYSGGSFATLSLLASNDDSGGFQSAVSFDASAGVAYAIQVDGYSDASGAVVVNHPPVGTVTGVPRVTDEPDDVSVLVGTPFDLSLIAQGDGLSYQWLFNDAPLAGATTASLHVAAAAFADSGSYRARVTNSHGVALSRAASVTVERVSVQPGNNDFADATPISGSGRQSGSNQLTNGELGEPDRAAVSQPLASVWYRYTASANGTLAVNTAGSNFDTVLAAYSGVTVDTLSQRAPNDDSGGASQSAISFGVTSGEVYYLAVDGFNSAEGNITIDYSFVPDLSSIPNDLFAAATTFTGTTMQGSNIGGHGEPGEPNHNSRSTPLASAWWQWTATTSGFVEFDTLGSDFDTTLAVYTGRHVDELTLHSANDDFDGRTSRLGIAVVAGQTYRVAVDGFAAAEGHIQLNIRASAARADVAARYSALRGANIYYPDSQEVRSAVRRPTTRGITYFVTNTGTQAGRFRVALSGSLFSKGIVSALIGTRGDVIAQARAGTLLTEVLAPGEVATYTLKIRTRGARTPPNYLYSAYLRASNPSGAPNPDQVRTLLVVH